MWNLFRCRTGEDEPFQDPFQILREDMFFHYEILMSGINFHENVLIMIKIHFVKKTQAKKCNQMETLSTLEGFACLFVWFRKLLI